MDLDGQKIRKEQASESVQLLDGLLRVSQHVRLRFNEWLDRFDLNDGRHAVLSVLARTDTGVCSQSQLADRLGLSESNISTLIERMQRDGLVSRTKSELDRRKRLLEITAAGRAILDAVEADRTVWADNLLKGFRRDDQTRMLELMMRFVGTLESSKASSKQVSDSAAGNKTALTTVDSDPATNLESPQIALRRMLLALSSSGEREPHGQEAA